ncbi:TRAP transporter permease [Tepidiphilus thermophilus]|uniref:TRAP transporter, 4TM/12TM fusion protein n=1 Tax=Tepidiphilus thermophilus TaxID=876478 RepID=A0A0K6IT44_9PROT|nr:TRAP transporter permease [Tepidiphilus thermophilus]CUB06275.1 TRAP transporter, 4TM/12TM fusion protein [Tepidiphilus thermophilus]
MHEGVGQAAEDERGVASRLLFLIAVAFSLFQLYTAAFTPFSSLVTRAVHVGFLLTLTFGFLARDGLAKGKRLVPLLFLACALLAAGVAAYQWVFEHELMLRSGEPTSLDLWIGITLMVLVFLATQRMMGWALPLICGVLVLYAVYGRWLPEPLNHRGYPWEQVIEHLSFGTEGIYGIPIYVSSSYIFLFILFGAFLERAGMLKLFTDFALGLVGHTQGGPAKVAVVASALMGTINGSGVANVVTTGQFTIRLMKQFGYRAEFAGGVEATASMGGQIMPPVMGAVAFIMAETIGVEYVEVARAALIPAILYFVTAFWVVHLEAGRLGLTGMPKESLPNPWRAVRERWHLVLPLAVLVYLLFSGYTPLFAGLVGLLLTVVLILGASLSEAALRGAIRTLFWIVLGLICAAFFRWGIAPVLVLIAVLVLACAFLPKSRPILPDLVAALAEGARQALPVGIACAQVGVIIGVMTLTGAASSFANAVLAVGQHSLFLSLLLTMLVCLVLGMGIPTIPNYIITSSLAAPALLHLGVPLIVSHMFVFYFGIMADLTPPVALACFAAAPIAGASGLAISLQAIRVAVAGFIIPFMAVYAPALMLQGDPGWLEVAYVVFKALLAIWLWGCTAIGHWLGPLSWFERLWAFVAAALLVAAVPLTDELGLAAGLALLGWHFWRHRPRPAPTA